MSERKKLVWKTNANVLWFAKSRPSLPTAVQLSGPAVPRGPVVLQIVFPCSFIFHFVFFFYRGNISSRPQRASCPAGSHCFRAKLQLDQSDSWHSDLPCYQTNMVIGHKLILPSSVFLGRTSLITQSSVWSFDYHFRFTAVLASLQIGKALSLL